MEKRIMAEGKRSYPVGTVLLLVGPPDGKVMDVEFTVVEEVDKDTLRVKGIDGNVFRVHKSRIKKVVREAESKPTEDQVPEAPKGPTQEELLSEIRDLLKK
jgi:hypothetical protein